MVFMYFLSAMSFFLSATLLYLGTALMLDWPMTTLNSANITFQLMFDYEGTFFSAIVTFITANILVFSKFYMNNNTNMARFTHLIIMFVLSMNMLIFLPNLMFTMIGWDGLGVTSFLLVIFFHNSKSLKSGLITAFTNRLGDTFILIAIALLSSQGQWSLVHMWSTQKMLLIFIVAASLTKSAQIPFSAWLPEAMAAPTPVSALVHSSTLVTAGVFLMIRAYPALAKFNELMSLLLFLGCLSAYLGSLWGMTNMDPKKVVALSTMSQLGLMVAMIGAGMPQIAFFHLITHAMFKSLLFVCVGFSIDLKHHTQNFQGTRLRRKSPLLTAGFVMSLGSLNAAPWFAGFYSKDLILEYAVEYTGASFYSPIPLMVIGATLNTAIYTIRLWRANVMAQNPMAAWGPHLYPGSLNAVIKILVLPVSMLSLGSLMMGAMTVWFLHTYPIVTVIPPLSDKELPLIGPWPSLSGVMFALCMCLLLKNNWDGFAGSMKFLNLMSTNHKKGLNSPLTHLQYMHSLSGILGGKFKKPKIWPLDEYPSKSVAVPIDVAEGRYFTAVMNGLTPINIVIAKYTLSVADNIAFHMENGWAQMLGPSNSFFVLLRSSIFSIPKYQPSFVANTTMFLMTTLILTTMELM